MPVRVKDAAEILGVSAVTVRRWCNEGKLEHSLSAAGQRLFDEKYLRSIVKKINNIEESEELQKSVFYVRSSSGSDVSLETQIKKLTKSYGEAHKVFSDKSSGLNENRKGLKSLVEFCKKNDNVVIYISNKDRLSRFGFSYLLEVFDLTDSKVVVLDSDETKEPHEVLMQDFMSLLASFSGKFYRIRGWEQQKKFLKDVKEEVNNHEQWH